MKVAVAVLTYNVIENDRRHLLDSTIASVRAKWAGHDRQLFVVDNGSTDGTADIVAEMGGYCSTDENTTSGHGTNLCARIAVGSGADLCVISDDDMWWRPGSLKHLVAWWEQAPDWLVLTGCHLEPLFPWNEVLGTLTLGTTTGLLRASTGAASWSFRAKDWPQIGPVPEKRQGHGDVPACERLQARGHSIAQLDLALHAGHGQSSWGNRTVEMYGWELAPVRRMLREAVPA